MNPLRMCLIAGLALALNPARGGAAYLNLSVTSFNTTVTFSETANPTAVTIHRVWANFSNPNDALFVWGGGGSLGPATINTNSPGGFLNDIHGGIQPPNVNAAVSAQDSFFTIGVTLQSQIPTGQGLSLFTVPGSPFDVTGTTIDLGANGGGMATAPITKGGAPNPISLAGFTGDGDVALRVLLMQLVVAQGTHVSGSIGIIVNNGALAGATTTIQNQTFGPASPPNGVCCTPTSCAWTVQPFCGVGNSVFFSGPLTCTLCDGACCTSDGACAVTTFANCAASGGTFRGYSSQCGAKCVFGDIDGDGHVDVDDLLAVIEEWGACAVPCPPCAADLNSSCEVDVDDLVLVIEHWLP